LIFAWTFFFATYLGFRANWALFELSGRSLSGKLAYFFDPVGLAVFGILAAFLGLLAYGTGSLVHRGLSRLRRVQLLGDS
jgi:hypothetical protein